MAKQKEYSSAIITFLDRKSQKEKVMAYPITKIELNEFIGDGVKAVKIFVIKDGKWIEKL